MSTELEQATEREDGVRLAALRRRVETVADRAVHLPPKERAVVELALRRGLTTREMSRLLGVRERTLGRRLARVLRRMQARPFVFVATHLGKWGPRRRGVATECVLHGRSQRRAAASLGMRVHEVRRELIAIKAMAEGAG